MHSCNEDEQIRLNRRQFLIEAASAIAWYAQTSGFTPLHDSNFEVTGVRDCVEATRQVYSKIFHANDRLVAVYPDAGHQFPPDIRQMAYEFLDRWLKDGLN